MLNLKNLPTFTPKVHIVSGILGSCENMVIVKPEEEEWGKRWGDAGVLRVSYLFSIEAVVEDV